MTELLILVLTGSCNFGCVYCYASHQKPIKMTPQVISRTVGMLREEASAGVHKPVIVQFTGGEPLLAFDRLQAAVQQLEAERLPVSFQLQTNGSLVTAEQAAFIRKHHIAVGVSLDGIPAVNDRLRPFADGSPSTAATVRGIRQLGDAGIEIGITCVVSKENVLHLTDLVDLAYYLGNVRQIGFNLLRPCGRGKGLDKPSSKEVREGIEAALQRVKEMKELTGRELIVSQLAKIRKLQQGYQPFSHCYALHEAGLYVDPVGDIYGCASLSGQGEYKLGSVFTGIGKGKRAALASTLQPVVAYCSACPDISLCGGGCYSRSYQTGQVDPIECALKRACIHFEKASI